MPISTKNFLLFLLVCIFGVVGGVSWLQVDNNVGNQGATLIYGLKDSPESEVAYQAVLPEAKPNERPARLQNLQGKIAQFFSNDEPTTGNEAEAEIVPDPEPVIASPVSEVLLCSNYSRANILWDSANIKFSVTEGARILYREGGVEMASGTILQLPINSFKGQKEVCLTNDIVGIALDGSLMRNDEDQLYKIFSGETLIGYALDGFPIYGMNNDVVTDSCGGITQNGSYRYYLNKDRDGILGCFSGSPVSL